MAAMLREARMTRQSVCCVLCAAGQDQPWRTNGQIFHLFLALGRGVAAAAAGGGLGAVMG